MTPEAKPEKIPRRIDSDEEKQDAPPDQERGERLESGKAIARGGKDAGAVPGATPQTDDDDENP